MKPFRTETDQLGTREIEADVLYGIHTVRALENFPVSGRTVNPSLVHAYGAVKYAALKSNQEINPWSDEVYNALETACCEMMNGDLDQYVVVDALQGGAGTSTNMNVNEVLANRALQILDKPLGSYGIIDPLEDVNRHQSTNDTYPTALKVAAIQGIRSLAESLTILQEAFQQQEHKLNDVVKVGRTEMQDAVLTTIGREMSAYAEAFSRDRWRVFKCEERLRVVNLGGTAIGTGLGAPQKYIFNVTDQLREITGIGLARAENLVDATQNTDAFVEVSGILKTQAGSSIMPGKVNPVVPEAVTQAALKVIANDSAITSASMMGHLELNAFMPLIADALLENISLLDNACRIMAVKCVAGIKADREKCAAQVNSSTACLTAFVDKIGYNKVKELAAEAKKENKSIKEILVSRDIVTAKEYQETISPEQVMRLGSR
ncbi:MAG: aspartate ammonia-lyase [Planctomycetota bacterium]